MLGIMIRRRQKKSVLAIFPVDTIPCLARQYLSITTCFDDGYYTSFFSLRYDTYNGTYFVVLPKFINPEAVSLTKFIALPMPTIFVRRIYFVLPVVNNWIRASYKQFRVCYQDENIFILSLRWIVNKLSERLY